MTRTAMALMLGMMMPSVVIAGPQVLRDSELDAVTAAGVLVAVDSIAHANGDHIVADTNASTSVRGGPFVQVGVGFSDGNAAACCGIESDVTLNSTAVGAGDLVFGKTYTVDFRGASYAVGGGFAYFAFGYTGALMLAISYEDGFGMLEQTVQERQDGARVVSNAARQLLGASRDNLTTGFELGAAIAAGMRWQAAQDSAAGYHDLRRLSNETGMSLSEIQ